MLKIYLNFFLLTMLTTATMAQKKADKFLSEVFAIESFKINSSLQDVQRDKQIAENLSLFIRIDNTVDFNLTGQQINLPGLKPLDRFAFDTIELKFENDKLHDINLYLPKSFKDVVLAKSLAQFNAEYGEAAVVEMKNNKYKKFVWNLGTNELVLTPFRDGLEVHYGSKIPAKKTGWIYRDRKGKGNGTIQFNLPYFEKLIGAKLTIASFEKILPEWQTTGTLNHLSYDLNFSDLSPSRPVFYISYFLNGYNLAIKTIDTTTMVINEITLNKIKDPNIFLQFEKELDSLDYVKEPKIKYINHVDYTNRKFSVILDKGNSEISIMNEFKIKLP